MFMILKREWEALDGSVERQATLMTPPRIPAGRHEIEKIPNPYGYKGFWLVLKGTKIGASEGSWRQWAPEPNIDWGDLEVVIEEDNG